jgi:hypothetical protein
LNYKKYNLWDSIAEKNYYRWTLSWLVQFLKSDSILVPGLAKDQVGGQTQLQSILIDGKVIAMGTEWGNKRSISGQQVLDMKFEVGEKDPRDILVNAVSAYISPEENIEEFFGLEGSQWLNKDVQIPDADVENDIKNRARHVIDNSDVVVSLRRNDEVPHNFYKRDLDRIDSVEILREKIDPNVWITGDEVMHHIAASGYWLFLRLDEPGSWIVTISNYSPRFGGGHGAIYHGKSTYTLEVK